MDEEALLARYARPVPRYTSYPSTPHFAPLEPAIYREWLGALPRRAELSLYLHVPFCRALCLFCGCHTTVVRRPQPIAAYAATLRAEIELVAQAIGSSLAIRHLHWGGGTPTMLGAVELTRTMAAVARHFSFAADAEIAVEIDPRTLTRAMAKTLGELGITRASLGVQDFDPVVQQSVHRVQPFAQVAEAVAMLRQAGIAGINLDLMYGLPHQSAAGVAETAGRALDLMPDRLAVFGSAHVPWMKRHQALLPQDALPDTHARYRQQQAIARVLTDAGYIPVGFDHYSRPGDALASAVAAGRLRRNFQGYTTDTAPVLLGLGASAISALPDAYAQNAARVPEWRSAVAAGRLPTARGLRLSPEDRLRRDVIEQIMCRLTVDVAATAARHGAPAEPLRAAPLAGFAADRLIRWDGSRLEVTARGRPFLRTIAAAFDAYQARDARAARYSQGV
jgi:oxygen-independent coproporphyrinogen-3 oxidase